MGAEDCLKQTLPALYNIFSYKKAPLQNIL
jgi:hypothetical protein